MKFSDKFNLKNLPIVLAVIYVFVMFSLEDSILSAIFGINYTDDYPMSYKSYQLFISILPVQFLICYIYKFVAINKLKPKLILVSLGLWLFLLGFTFL